MKSQKMNAWTTKRQLEHSPLRFLQRFAESGFDALNVKFNKDQLFLHRLSQEHIGAKVSFLDLEIKPDGPSHFLDQLASAKDLLFPLGEGSLELSTWLITLQRYLGVELTAYLEQKQKRSERLERFLGDPIRWSVFYLSHGIDLRKAKRRQDQQFISFLESLSPLLSKSLYRVMPLRLSAFNPHGYALRQKYKEISHVDPLKTLEHYFRQLEFCHQVVETLTWIIWCLDSSPQLLEKIRVELNQTVRDEIYQTEHIRGLPITLGVILETLRLAPPYWLCRWDTDQDLLLKREIDEGLKIAIRDQFHLLSSPYLHHKDPLHWPSPQTFEPMRFQALSYGGSIPPRYYPLGPGESGRNRLIVMVHSCVVILNSVLKRGKIKLSEQVDPSGSVSIQELSQWEIESAVGVGFGSDKSLSGSIEFDERFVYIPSARI